jgi:hypothetical protein
MAVAGIIGRATDLRCAVARAKRLQCAGLAGASDDQRGIKAGAGFAYSRDFAKRGCRPVLADLASLKELSWIENALWVEGIFHFAMKRADFRTGGKRPPPLLGQADAMLARNDAVPFQDLMK